METNNETVVQNNTETAPIENSQVEQQAEQVAPDTTQQAPAVPEKYDLKLDDGSLLDAAYVEQFSQFAKDKKLTQDQAQEFLQREAQALNSFVQKQQQEFEKVQAEWVNQIKNDSEIGGEKFNQSIELAHRALKQFASDSFLKELETTGYGNHPELVRVFAKIGNMIKEDKMISPSAAGGTRSIEEIFYGKN
jgi:hypothetical protein